MVAHLPRAGQHSFLQLPDDGHHGGAAPRRGGQHLQRGFAVVRLGAGPALPDQLTWGRSRREEGARRASAAALMSKHEHSQAAQNPVYRTDVDIHTPREPYYY